MENEDFLGRGWGFPPTFHLADKSVSMVQDHEDIHQSLQILFSTDLGERVLRSDYGSTINTMPYENITVTLLTKVKRLIEKAILKYEPRITLNDIFFTNASDQQGIIHIEIQYTVRATNSRLNYVFPFYIEEGTHIKS